MKALASILVVGAVLAGCSSDERRPSSTGGLAPAAPDGVTTTTTASATSGGSGGGADGAGGAAGAAEPPPLCAGNRAFRAAGLSFADPTPAALALALSEALFGYDAHAVSLVLVGDTPDPSVLVTATEEGGDGMHRPFLADAEVVPASWLPAGFSLELPQEVGELRWADGALELRNISFEARANATCDEVWVVLDAIVPVEEADVELPLSPPSTVEQVAGPPPGQGPNTGLGWSVRAFFQAESIAFDFDGMGP